MFLTNHICIFCCDMTSVGVNGLPQGSVLAPILFNLYSNDLPVTHGRKFIYADDICLAIQGQYFSELECSLSSDMARMSHFCRQWRLKPSASKTISSVFHLHNTSATRELSVYLDGPRLRHECHPTYLGVTLDRTLSYREHLTKTAGKLKNRNNLVMKLAGSTWGASTNTLLWHFAISSRVLHPSLVMLCSHKSGRCAVGGSILESTEGHGRGVEQRVPEMIRMSHIVESLPLTKLNDGLSRLHSADKDAVSWLTSYGSWHAYEKKKWQCHRSVSGLASFSVNFSSKMTIILRTPLMPAVTKVVKLKMPFTVASMRSCKYIPYHLPYCILHDMGGICPKFGVIELAINAVLWTL